MTEKFKFVLGRVEILWEKEKTLVTSMFSFLAYLSTTCSRGAFRVVMCLSCVCESSSVSFKHLLLPNRWANLDQTWQECSLWGPLQKLFTEFDSIKNSGYHGNEIEFFKQFLKSLLWNRWSDFEIISHECSLGDPFQKLIAKFWSVHKHGSGEWGLVALYGHKEILKKSSSPKLLVRFWNNFAGMFLEWPFSKIVGEILIRL